MIDNWCTFNDYKLVFKSMPVGLVIFDIESRRILEINPFMLSWLGYERHELLYAGIETVFDTGCLQNLKESGRNGTGKAKECRIRKKDGVAVEAAVLAGALRLQDRSCLQIIAGDISKLRQAELELRKSEEKFRAVFEGAAIGVTIADIEGRLLDTNPALQEMLGFSADELRSMIFTEFTHPDDIEADMALHRELVAGKRSRFEMEKRYIRKDGGLLWARLSVSLVRGENGEPQSVIGMVEDITERKKAEEELLNTHRQLLQIIDFLPDATFVIDRDRKVIAWNRAMEGMTGISKKDILNKGDYAYAIPFYGYPKPILIDRIFSEMDAEHWYESIEKRGDTLFAEVFLPAANNGKGVQVSITASPLFDGSGEIVGAIETIRDITERNRMRDRLQYMATHDFLTNIPNRYSLEENIRRAVAKAKRGELSAFLLIDIDNFKLINDTLGHAAGDEFLITMTSILKSNLREGDLLARLGGDEFAVLLEGVSAEEAGNMAEKLREMVDREELCLTTHKTCFSLTISIGIVMIDGSLNSQKLMSLADAALYSAKDAGRNKVAFLKPDQLNIARGSEDNRMVALIKRALREGRFILFFQPIFGMGGMNIVHYEALIRMVDDNGDLILPGRFIPLAERFGLMSQIDRWVVRSAFAALQRYSQIKLFVNLSGTTLGDERLIELIVSLISQTGIDPARLGFEITETAAVKDYIRAERWINSLKKMGCQFALDDFGIGFSSFTYLRMLPVDFLKIDGSYIKNIDRDPTQRALVQAIKTVAKSLGKGTIAEFVESESVYRVLEELEIDCVQGFYTGEPGPLPKPGEVIIKR